MTGLPGDVTNYYAYAVDPNGAATLLGPITFNGGVGTATFDTPLNQFMVVLSPNQGLTTIDPTTAVMFRSDVPSGYTIVPRKAVGDTRAVAVSGTAGAYDVPMLNVHTFGDKTRELKIKFGGDRTGLKLNRYAPGSTARFTSVIVSTRLPQACAFALSSGSSRNSLGMR